ncbi:gephyrin-like molybdotransferase Glp [Enterovirga rhinocerotis]|uniref:Molybdopterin molybdenumtransferase n=1 Tax=Enterovirga rhinocerotis TaxID=1339210 RepID=A0A4R7C3U2_9HYPH|nr:gephyrin-like molybdotransferase Glp [Enterovirga rhinocerotis]TDR93170.1 molybdopterin molybdotransferase [Enterovirga rhinocerotis]
MAQLTDDCFAVGAPILTVDEAVALIRERVAPVAGVETVALVDADGRVLADDILAAMSVPRTDNSAVDGYAVRHADLALSGETVLPVRGRVAAGQNAGGISAEGVAVRIFTGAPMPPFADTVFMQEDVRLDGDAVVLPSGLPPGANRRRAGEDIEAGDVVARAGQRLHPQHLALATAVGLQSLAVRRRLRVALFSTGDELAEPGGPLGAGMIHDSNRVMLIALLRRLGAETRDHGILRDDPDLVAQRLSAASAEADLLVTSGGVSVGEEDHVKAAVERIGRLDLWRLAIKPGRPVAMGTVAGVPFVGLPGNPVAAYVTCLMLLAPLLARLGGADGAPPLSLPVRAAFSRRKKRGRREFVRVTLRVGADGQAELVPFPRDGAALMSSLIGSDGLAEIPDDATSVCEGDLLRFHPHAALQG